MTQLHPNRPPQSLIRGFQPRPLGPRFREYNRVTIVLALSDMVRRAGSDYTSHAWHQPTSFTTARVISENSGILVTVPLTASC